MRVLVIEDDVSTRASLELILSAEKHSVQSVGFAREGLQLATRNPYDMILLDMNLPDMLGFEFLNWLRESDVHTPVVIVSGMADPDDRTRAFRLGADEYLMKPFHREELIARIGAVARRTREKERSLLTIGEIEMDLDSKTVEVRGEKVPLTATEFSMLELLALRKGTMVSKSKMMAHLYDGRDDPDLKIIDVFICKMRRKLREFCAPIDYIDTIWGHGYVLREPEHA